MASPSFYPQQNFQSWFSGRENPGGSLAKPHINVPLVPHINGLMKTEKNVTATTKNVTESDYYN